MKKTLAPFFDEHVYCVILAGGSGKRLWPLSNKFFPKQMIPFLGDRSLLEQTIERVAPLMQSKNNILVVTSQQYAPIVQEHVGALVGEILAEPEPRNTGPAVLFSIAHLMQNDPRAKVIFLPADHYIPDGEYIRSILCRAVEKACQQQNIVLLGVKPLYPATGYGYMRTILSEHEEKPVAQFCEKPHLALAEEFFKNADMLWNIGVIVGSLESFLQAFSLCQPAAISLLRSGFLIDKFNELPALSIDVAVLEKMKNLSVLRCEMEWYDVGNILVFLNLQKKYFPGSLAPVINVSAQNNLVQSKKIVAFVGVSDVCVVETDDALLIVSQREVEAVKEIADKLYETHSLLA